MHGSGRRRVRHRPRRPQAVTRYTGRAGLVWFALIFTLAARHRFAGGPVLDDALRVLVAFGVHHTVHLALLLTYLHAAGHPIVFARAAGGMVGYALLYAMIATASDRARLRMGPFRWKALHEISLWYLWIVFVLTYVPRLQGKVENAGGGTIEFVAAMTLLVALAAYRATALAKGKIRTHPSAPRV